MSGPVTLASGGTLSAKRAPTGEVVMTAQVNGQVIVLVLTGTEACRIGTLLQNTAGACLPPSATRAARFADLLRRAG